MGSIITNVLKRLSRRRLNYPQLSFRKEGKKEIWEGILPFCHRFDDIRIKDAFKIRIEIPTPGSFPIVQEIGDRVDTIQNIRKINDKRDLHINPDTNTICLCVRPEEKRLFPNGVNLNEFIERLAIPYFFALSYFEKNRKWPWAYYSHGIAGILEYYLDKRNTDDPNLLSDCLDALKQVGGKTPNLKGVQVNGRERCICGSKKKFKKCHRKALNGLQAMIEDIEKNEIPK